MLNRLNSFVPLILVGIFVLMGYAWVTSERGRTADSLYWAQCNLDFNKASSLRQSVLNVYAINAASKRGAMDQALSVLVAARGGPNTAATIQAQSDWEMAFAGVQTAEGEFEKARITYPPPLLEDFCQRLKDLPGYKPNPTPTPKAGGATSPAPKQPSATP